MKPAALLLLIAGVAGATLCVGLGLWQWGRWQERRAILAELEHALAEIPRSYRDTLPTAEEVVGRRITLSGRYDENRQFLMRGRPNAGEPGVEVVTPLVMSSGPAVLVNRGWLASEDGAHARPQDYPEPGEREVTGYAEPLTKSPPHYPYLRLAGDTLELYSAAHLDPDSVTARLPYRLAGFWLRESPGPDVAPVPRRSLPPMPNPGMHLGYAIQWFAIAALILAGSIWLGRSRRLPGAASRGPAAGR